MIEESRLEKIVRRVLQEKEAFLVELKSDEHNQIQILVDDLPGITLEKLGQISRGIEELLDRETEDFSLTLSSPGVGSPLKVADQYQQNIGRLLKVQTVEGEFRGRLEQFSEGKILLSWSAREPKPVGKGKRTVKKEKKIALADVTSAIVEIEFK